MLHLFPHALPTQEATLATTFHPDGSAPNGFSWEAHVDSTAPVDEITRAVGGVPRKRAPR